MELTLDERPPRTAAAAPRAVAIWLIAVAILIFIMVVVGGVTRLTRSGLSIVEWNPVMGAIPPLSEQHWQVEFGKYRQTPEYKQVNAGMSLDAFKRIYYVEWTHRLLGRLIGLVFFLPLVYFALRRRLPKPLVPKLIAIFVVGGLQGALGWFMVQSGLVDVPRVSPYRLTAHLGLAVAIYGFVVWLALDLLQPQPTAAAGTDRGLRRFGWLVTGLVFLMILAGGFVAGTKAGFAFNTFPLMNGAFMPPGTYALEPWWVNHFENVATVQFTHRVLAYVLLVATAAYWWRGRRAGLLTRRALQLLLAALLVQIGLGIATLLLSVPVWLGAAHQAGALAVFTIALFLNHSLRSGAGTTSTYATTSGA